MKYIGEDMLFQNFKSIAIFRKGVKMNDISANKSSNQKQLVKIQPVGQ